MQSKNKTEVGSLQEHIERLTEKLKKKQERCAMHLNHFTTLYVILLFNECPIYQDNWIRWH